MYPRFFSSQSKSAPYTAPTNTQTAGPLAVSQGDSVYVCIAFNGAQTGSTSVATVVDSAGNYYRRVAANRITGFGGGLPNPAVDIWCADNVAANAGLDVTVTFNNSCQFIFIAVDVEGGSLVGSIDLTSAGQTSIGAKTSSDQVRTVSPNDIVAAIQCTVLGCGALASGGGFASYYEAGSGPTTGYDLQLDVWTAGPSPPADFNSSLSWGTSEAFALITICIRSPIGWGGATGRPVITVSPSLTNDGSDYGPWSPVSGPNGPTWGIQEALNYAGALPNGATVVLRTSVGPFEPTESHPMHGFFIPPKVHLTTDRPHMKKASLTVSYADPDIIINSYFTPIDAFLVRV